MNAREFLVEEILKYNSTASIKEIEKALDKYQIEEIERLVDAMIRFGTDEIFKALINY